ncbi:MAG: FG-GAP-like repeat-containing protein [Gammaproteobacteria bacterium]|nr:FG-GAP-like repeat-containing protein [Gammaproteobacteria bacterium]
MQNTKSIIRNVASSIVVSGLLSGHVYAFNPVVEWAWTSSPVIPLALNVMGTPSVIDLNKDGTPDVVFGATASTGGGLVETGYLRALNGDNGTELFTVTNTSYLISSACSVATGDIDNDSFPEIIACDNSGRRLIAFEHDGTFKWRSPVLETNYWGAASIADLDKDGNPEIIIGRQVLNNAGALMWTGTGGRSNQGSTGPLSLVADVDIDGSPDVVAGNTIYDAAGNIKWQTPLPDGYNAVGNFDTDSLAEIVLVSGGRVWLLEHDGSVKWGPVSIPAGGIGGPPTVADYDNDGEPEIGVAGASRYAVFETDGSLKWSAVVQDRSSNRTGSSVFDFEDDGVAEVVYSDETSLWVFRGTDGTVLFRTPLSSCTWHEYPLVADVDGDDRAEILAVANRNCGYGPQQGVFVYGDEDDEWVLTRQIWNQHTYHITNVNPDGTIPVSENDNWLEPGLNNFRLNTFGSFEGPACDIDADGVVDINDIRAIAAARNTPAVPGDARDVDGDGVITLNDARQCVLQCSNPRCAP